MDGVYNHHFYETAFYYVGENEGKYRASQMSPLSLGKHESHVTTY